MATDLSYNQHQLLDILVDAQENNQLGLIIWKSRAEANKWMNHITEQGTDYYELARDYTMETTTPFTRAQWNGFPGPDCVFVSVALAQSSVTDLYRKCSDHHLEGPFTLIPSYESVI